MSGLSSAEGVCDMEVHLVSRAAVELCCTNSSSKRHSISFQEDLKTLVMITTINL